MSCEVCSGTGRVFATKEGDGIGSVFRCECDLMPAGWWRRVPIWSETKYPGYQRATPMEMRAMRKSVSDAPVPDAEEPSHPGGMPEMRDIREGGGNAKLDK